MSKPDHQWEKLVKAARKAPPDGDDHKAPPRGFISRIVGFREAVANFARTLAWRRWSVFVALASAGILLAVLAVTRCDQDSDPLIAPPKSISPEH